MILTASSFTTKADSGNYELEPLFKDKDWKMSAELGVLLTSGNTNSTSFLGKFGASHEWQEWRFQYNFSGLFKQNEEYDAEQEKDVLRTTAERYAFDAQGNVSLSDTNGVFAFFSHVDDKFASFLEYTTIVGGYEFRAIYKRNMTLDLNLGPGYARGINSENETEQGPVIRASGAYQWKISDNARFVQNLSVQTSGFNNQTISETSLITKITGSMQMKVGFRATHNSEVEGTTKRLDTETSVTLVINF